jgi:hypothetical protein
MSAALSGARGSLPVCVSRQRYSSNGAVSVLGERYLADRCMGVVLPQAAPFRSGWSKVRLDAPVDDLVVGVYHAISIGNAEI